MLRDRRTGLSDWTDNLDRTVINSLWVATVLACCDNIAESTKKTISPIGMAVGARAHMDTELLSLRNQQ